MELTNNGKRHLPNPNHPLILAGRILNRADDRIIAAYAASLFEDEKAELEAAQGIVSDARAHLWEQVCATEEAWTHEV
jgi:hypothetical protein